MPRASSLERGPAACACAGYVSVAFGCPYDGPVAPATTAARRRPAPRPRLRRDQPGRHDRRGDARGRAPGPGRGAPGSLPSTRVGLHAHDTRGQALANVYAALERGVAVIDSSAGGLGGCPFAGPGAVGNLATEDLVYLLDGLGIEHGVDLDGVMAASSFIAGSDRACAPQPDIPRGRAPHDPAAPGNGSRRRGVDPAPTRRRRPPMRRPIRRPFRTVAVVLAAIAVLVLADRARCREGGHDGHPRCADPDGHAGGTELLVGITVTMPDETGAALPVEGTPVYLTLVGQDGSHHARDRARPTERPATTRCGSSCPTAVRGGSRSGSTGRATSRSWSPARRSCSAT